MKAADGNSGDGGAAASRRSVSDLIVRHIEQTCRTVIDGRLATRALAAWARQFSLSEPEFQLLWCLRSSETAGLDQTTLARRLATSPAKISTTVERLRASGWIDPHAVAGDRRRQCWRLTRGGRNLLEEMLAAAARLRFEPAAHSRSEAADGSSQEAAA